MKTLKVYIVPVPSKLQPARTPLIYPRHNRDYSVEQDFFQFLQSHPQYIARSRQEADWHYLPIFWSRWHIARDYGQIGREELQQAVDSCLGTHERTFTICAYASGPLVELGKTTIFQASRRDDKGIDVPLISWPHRRPLFAPAKKYTASFVGRVSTHPIRQAMFDALKDRSDIFLYEGEDKDSAAYVRTLLEARVALCPRGYGGSSYRLYEALELSIVPFLIGDLDTRPFKRFIDWDAISLFAASTEGLSERLDVRQSAVWQAMGRRAAQVYQQSLRYQKWCSFVFNELEQCP